MVNGDIALSGYKKAAEDGYAHKQWELGYSYKCGMLGLQVDKEKALGMYQKAAEGGDGLEQYKISQAYYAGDLGLDAGQVKAFELLHKAAEGGCSDAQLAVKCIESTCCYCDFCMHPEQVCEDSAIVCGKPLWARKWALSDIWGEHARQYIKGTVGICAQNS